MWCRTRRCGFGIKFYLIVDLFKSYYANVVTTETNLITEFNQNPFIFDDVSVLEYSFYVSRVVNTLEEKTRKAEEEMEELKRTKGRNII